MTELSALRAVAEQVAAAQGVAGLAIAVARGEQPVERCWFGVDAAGQPVEPASLMPVASLTKLALALAVLRLIDRGALGLDDLLGRHLPTAVAAGPGVTIRALLCHTAGLPHDLGAEAPPYQPGLDWPALGRGCLATPPEAPPGQRVQYSNVGYGLLALVVERLAGQPYPAALQQLVLGPLGLAAWLGDEPPRPPLVLADIRGGHLGTPLEPFNSRFWRSLAMPWGGLVTSLDGALGLVQAYRGRPPGFLSPALLAEARRDQTAGLGGGMAPPLWWDHSPWGLGPELRGHKRPHWAPPEAAPSSFGHAGASGCLAWADPQANLAWAILGTRTADAGWLVRGASAIGSALLAAD